MPFQPNLILAGRADVADLEGIALEVIFDEACFLDPDPPCFASEMMKPADGVDGAQHLDPPRMQ
jgi:hypothetical protein